MITSTTENIPGQKIQKVCGIARGNTIRARHIGKDILALFQHMLGGEVRDYTKLLGEAREQALDRMISYAEDMGANAVVQVRFSTSILIGGAAEIMAYGTAVILEQE